MMIHHGNSIVLAMASAGSIAMTAAVPMGTTTAATTDVSMAIMMLIMATTMLFK